MSRILFAIGLLLLLLAGGFWLRKPDIPTSGSPTAIQSPVPQATLRPLLSLSTPTATLRSQTITIETPASGTLVGSPVVITGSTAAYPAQGQLQYRIVDEHKISLGSGAFTVTGTSDHTATFNVSLTFITPATPSRITVELFDSDPSTQTVIASAALSLTVNSSPILAPLLNDQFTPLAAPPPSVATPTTVIPTATSSVLSTETASAPAATPTPASSVIIEAQHPGWMDMGASDTINLSLKRIIAEMATSTSVYPDHTAIAGVPAIVGTPETVRGQAFDPGSDAVVIAQVVAPAFEVQSTGDEHPLDQNEVTWQWGITPKVSGHQLVIISVDGQWRSQADGRLIKRTLWRRDFYIDVYEPMLSRGQIDMASLLTGLAGSVLSIPWLVEQMRLWRQQRQSAIQTKRRVRQRNPDTLR